MQSKKKWWIIGGLVLVALVIGFAVVSNQGSLFRGALTPIKTTTDLNLKKVAPKQKPDYIYGQMKAKNGKTYNVKASSLFNDGTITKSPSLFNDGTITKSPKSGLVVDVTKFAKSGNKDLLMQLEEPVKVTIPDLSLQEKLFPEEALVPQIEQIKPTITEEIILDPDNENELGITTDQFTLSPEVGVKDILGGSLTTETTTLEGEMTQMNEVKVIEATPTMENTNTLLPTTDLAPKNLNINKTLLQTAIPAANAADNIQPIDFTKQTAPITTTKVTAIPVTMDENMLFTITDLDQYTDGVYTFSIQDDTSTEFAELKIQIVNATEEVAPPPADTDGDGVPDTSDNCTAVANPTQEDKDSDGIGDVCDPIDDSIIPPKDTDGDTVPDSSDNCPAVANPTQADKDSDGIGDVCDPIDDSIIPPKDTDGDGVPDTSDNCTAVANPTQEDKDSDGIGDVCNPIDNSITPPKDTDGDTVPDSSDNCPGTPNKDQADKDNDKIGDACDPIDNTTKVEEEKTSTDTTEKEETVVVTEKSETPCVVGGKEFYFAGGPDSTYCQDLKNLVNAQGQQNIFQADLTPETPQARYTTALATLRILKELGADIRTRNLSLNWYANLVDADEIGNLSSQELADSKTVYSSGVLKGRVNPQNKSEVTLAPLSRISYIELLSMFKQAMSEAIGLNVQVEQANLPTFIIVEYNRNPDWKWIAEAYSFGVEYNLITKDEFNSSTMFDFASRADMVKYLARFQNYVEENPSLLR